MTLNVVPSFSSLRRANELKLWTTFSFPATDGRFGISARTGGFAERATVDDVEITPR